MRERRRKQSSESADDDASHSPGPSHPLKKRRVQRPTPSVTPVPDEDLENQPSAMNNQAEDLLDMVIPERPAPAMSTDPDAPRLIITKIDVENFKSYYGKQTLGPFHKVSNIYFFTYFVPPIHNAFRISHRFWVRMEVERVMSLIRCCLCLDFAPTKYAPRRLPI
jgi:hypothetical protein